MPCSLAGPIVVICDVAKLLTAGAFTVFGVPPMIWLAFEPSDVFAEVAEAVPEDTVLVAVLVVVPGAVLVVVLPAELVLVEELVVPAAPEPDTAEASDAGKPFDAAALETAPLSVATISGAYAAAPKSWSVVYSAMR